MFDATLNEQRVVQQLFRSDRAYFEAAAKATRFETGTIVSMPGLESVPAGCVVLADMPLTSERQFVHEALVALSSFEASHLRFYTPRMPKHSAADLAKAGLRPTTEYAFLRDVELPNPEFPAAMAGRVSIRRVEGASGWLSKLELASALEHLPDGKKATAAEWTELERRKCEAGYMEMWILERDGLVCGSFGLSRCGNLLRLKNLAVHPDVRRLGFGITIVTFALNQARKLRLPWVGAFGLAGGGGSSLYTRCGFDIVGEQVEWSGPTSGRAASPQSSAVKLNC